MTNEEILLNVAHASIRAELFGRDPDDPDPRDYPPELRERRASFVTLLINGELRGCVGSLRARDPLVVDVARNAIRAAFNDPRFPPLEKGEEHDVRLEICILTPPEPLVVSGEEDLCAKLRPGIDGLTLSEGHHRATYLPSVWEDVPDPVAFVRHLKRKAGWDESYWSDGIQVERYTAIKIRETD